MAIEPINSDTYYNSLISQIGFEKQAFDSCLNFSLALGGLAIGAWMKFQFASPQNPAVSLTMASFAIVIIFALFLRSIRAYRNCHCYTWLKGEIVKQSDLEVNDPTMEDPSVGLISEIDVTRGDEGKKVFNMPKLQFILHCLKRNGEYSILFVLLFILETISINSIITAHKLLFWMVIVLQILSLICLYTRYTKFAGPKNKVSSATDLQTSP